MGCQSAIFDGRSERCIIRPFEVPPRTKDAGKLEDILRDVRDEVVLPGTRDIIVDVSRIPSADDVMLIVDI